MNSDSTVYVCNTMSVRHTLINFSPKFTLKAHWHPTLFLPVLLLQSFPLLLLQPPSLNTNLVPACIAPPIFPSPLVPVSVSPLPAV